MRKPKPLATDAAEGKEGRKARVPVFAPAPNTVADP
jgi:hypothetical protein